MNPVQKLARPDLWGNFGYTSQAAKLDVQLRLNCNESPWAPIGSTVADLNRYPERQPDKLLERLSQLFQVRSEHLLVTRGADDGIDALIRSFCIPGKDSIAQCPPAFVMYRFFANLHGVSVSDVPLVADDGFRVSFEQLSEDQESKIYFLCNPNNPTGTTIDPQSILDFVASVNERSLVVIDEAYVEFSSCESLSRHVIEHPNLVILRTLSKAWSLAGARLGAVIGHADLIDYLKATTSPYPLSRASIEAALQATSPENRQAAVDRIERIKKQRARLLRSLGDYSYVDRVYESDANFVLVQVEDADRFLRFMLERGILLRDQSSQSGLANHIRITAGSEQEMDVLLESMSQYAGVTA